MAKRTSVASWEISNAFWKRVEPLIPAGHRREPGREYVRQPGGGRKPKEPRRVFEALVYVLRTGCQWKALPKRSFGSASAIHKRFLEWEAAGFFQRLWQEGLAEYDDMEGIAWRWQSADEAMVKAPLAQKLVGPNPTNRGENGTKRMLLVDAHGVPLSLVVIEANRHDVTQLEPVLDAIIIRRPKLRPVSLQLLCADAGFAGQPAELAIRQCRFTPHVRSREEEKRRCSKGNHPRRWMVEVAHSWFNRFR